jgi:hypothetical protein
MSVGDVAQKLGEKWSKLSDRKKQPSITKATKLKKDEKDIADYESKGKFDGTKGPTKVAWEKVKEDEEDTAYLSPYEYLRVGSAWLIQLVFEV